MDKQKTVYIIQHIFDHFYFKCLKPREHNVEIWITSHAYILDKSELIKAFWCNKGFHVNIWNNEFAFVNTLNLFKIKRTKDELLKKKNRVGNIHIVDKTSIFSQLVLDFFDNVKVHQFNLDTQSVGIKRRINIKKTLYQTILSILFGFKWRLVKSIFTREAEMLEYPLIGKNFQEKYIILPKKIAKSGKKTKAVIFGGRFMQWGLTDKQLMMFSKKLNDILQRGYEQIFYIPHPLESKAELSFCQKFLGKLIVEKENIISAEDWLTDYSVDQIDTFSIGSTASKNSSELGYCSYVFYRDIFTCQDTFKAYDEIFSKSPVNHV